MSPITMSVRCLPGGALARPTSRVTESAHHALNPVIVHLSLPTVTPVGDLAPTSFVGLPTMAPQVDCRYDVLRRPTNA